MTNYEKIKKSAMLLRTPDDWFVTEIATGKQGVASITQDDKVAVFIGNDDGSDDRIISIEAFNTQFTVTKQGEED